MTKHLQIPLISQLYLMFCAKNKTMSVVATIGHQHITIKLIASLCVSSAKDLAQQILFNLINGRLCFYDLYLC